MYVLLCITKPSDRQASQANRIRCFEALFSLLSHAGQPALLISGQVKSGHARRDEGAGWAEGVSLAGACSVDMTCGTKEKKGLASCQSSPSTMDK